MTAATETIADAGPIRRATLSLARRFRCTEGQVQTITIGLLLALLTAAFGLPPVFEDRPLGQLAVPAPTASGGPADPGDGAAPPATVDAAVGGPAATPPVGSSSTGRYVPPADQRPDGGASGGVGGDPGSPPPAPGPVDLEDVAGRAGSCDVDRRSIENPRRVGDSAPTPVWIFEPTGTAGATITGGTCDDAERPVVLLAHGFGQTDPAAYEALIDHLVSVGNLVVYPVYEVSDGERASLEESHRVVDAGFVAAVSAAPRADTARVGVWGHSHGGGMVPFLTQQVGARGWGRSGLWLSNVAQAFTQLVGAADIPVPRHARAITVVFEHDGFADARLGNDVYRSLVLPPTQKRHVTVLSDPSSGTVAEHGAPSGTADQADAVDQLLWRYADLLQLCAFHGGGCDADLSSTPDADGASARRAVVSDDPVDVGPYPAILAECDAGFGPTLNPRIQRCGPTQL